MVKKQKNLEAISGKDVRPLTIEFLVFARISEHANETMPHVYTPPVKKCLKPSKRLFSIIPSTPSTIERVQAP